MCNCNPLCFALPCLAWPRYAKQAGKAGSWPLKKSTHKLKLRPQGNFNLFVYLSFPKEKITKHRFHHGAQCISYLARIITHQLLLLIPAAFPILSLEPGLFSFLFLVAVVLLSAESTEPSEPVFLIMLFACLVSVKEEIIGIPRIFDRNHLGFRYKNDY